MKKNTFSYYTIGWFIAVLLFHIMAFVLGGLIRSEWDTVFWVGYIFILIAFIGQILVAYNTINAENLQKTFYRIPLMRIAKVGLVLTTLVGSVFVLVPGLPAWIGALICLVILGGNIVSLLKASAAIELVEEIDEKISVDTAFIRVLTADAQTLCTRATNPAMGKVCKMVYEAIRYSDPMSHEDLNSLESQISLRFDVFAEAVHQGEEETARNIASELEGLLADRNGKCKFLKVQ